MSSALPPPRRALRMTLGVAGVGLGLLALYLGGLAAFALTARPKRADLIVVLGNAVEVDGRPSPRLRARLDAALAAYRRGLAPRIIVSGGVERDGRDEARAMARYLIDAGTPEGAVLQDPHGRDTFETARDTAAVMNGRGRVLVATQWFHVPRTVLAMRRFGLRRVSAIWPRFFEPRDAYSFLREAVGLPYYALRPLGGPAAAAPPPPKSPPAPGSPPPPTARRA